MSARPLLPGNFTPLCALGTKGSTHRKNSLLPGSHPEVRELEQVLESKEGGEGEPEAFWVQEAVCAKALRLWLCMLEQLNRDHCETGWR